MLTTISVRFKRENVKWLFKRKGLDMCLCMKSYQKTLKSEHPISFKNYLKDKKNSTASIWRENMLVCLHFKDVFTQLGSWTHVSHQYSSKLLLETCHVHYLVGASHGRENRIIL